MAWMILGLVLIAGYAFIARPLMDLYQERRMAIESSRTLIGTRLAIVARGDTLAARRDMLSARTRPRVDVIAARDTSAVADLQEHVRRVAIKHGLRVDTSRVLEYRAAPPLREVGVNVSLTGSVDRIQRLLRDLEVGAPMIRVSRLNLLGRPGMPELEISLEIAALAEGPANAD
jgi:Tfp pilus assembly protein PilO